MDRKQTVWRTFTSVPGCGYFVWEIYEVMEETNAFEEKNAFMEQFTKCSDGSYIYVIPPVHFWSKEKAEACLFEPGDRFMQPFIITGKSDLTMQKYRESLGMED